MTDAQFMLELIVITYVRIYCDDSLHKPYACVCVRSKFSKPHLSKLCSSTYCEIKQNYSMKTLPTSVQIEKLVCCGEYRGRVIKKSTLGRW